MVLTSEVNGMRYLQRKVSTAAQNGQTSLEKTSTQEVTRTCSVFSVSLCVELINVSVVFLNLIVTNSLVVNRHPNQLSYHKKCYNVYWSIWQAGTSRRTKQEVETEKRRQDSHGPSDLHEGWFNTPKQSKNNIKT